jgi:hypothetical protein
MSDRAGNAALVGCAYPLPGSAADNDAASNSRKVQGENLARAVITVSKLAALRDIARIPGIPIIARGIESKRLRSFGNFRLTGEDWQYPPSATEACAFVWHGSSSTRDPGATASALQRCSSNQQYPHNDLKVGG